MRTSQITAAQQELEQRVQERTRELSALQNVSGITGSTLSLHPLLGQILTEIKPVLDYRTAYIYQIGEAGNLVLISAAGDAPIFSLLVEGCWMGVPLVIKDHATGILVFVHQDPHYYRDEDARLALAFAQQVVVAIENARLYEQAGQLAALDERQRLARELHDSVTQVLYSIGLGAKTARAALEKDPSQLADALDYVNRLAEAGQVEMRALIFELRPESLRTDGLVTALEKQAAVLHSRYQMEVEVSLCPEPDVSLSVKETLYRITQEALHNIVKHAHATRVSLALQYSLNQICLEISDNGVGFDPFADYPGHFGLQSMHERAAQCRGRIQIDSAPGEGTKILFETSF